MRRDERAVNDRPDAGRDFLVSHSVAPNDGEDACLRNGVRYRQSLRDGRRVIMDGDVVEDVTSHPGLEAGIDTFATFPAVQNILIACRALGLGATLTTMHQTFEGELCERFGIPETHGVVAPIPIGYPLGRFGPVRRRPRVACRRGACQGASKRPETDRCAFTRSEQSKE